MTISYPRSFPNDLDRFQTCDFGLIRQEAVNPTYGGQLTGMELADAVWAAKYVSIPFNYSDRAIWQAWAASLKGVLNSFLGYDTEKRYPINYPSAAAVAALGGWGGVATVASNTATTVNLSALPGAYQVAVGDHISLPNSSQRTLHQVLEAATADVSGNVSLSVEPNIPSGVLTTAGGVYLVRPTCVMVIKPGSFSAPSSGTPYGPISFEAVQRLA